MQPIRQRSVLRPARRQVGGEAQKVRLVRGAGGVGLAVLVPVLVWGHGCFEGVWLQAGLLVGRARMTWLLRGRWAWWSVGRTREEIIGGVVTNTRARFE